MHYIRTFGDGKEELYEFASDPDETINLVETREAGSQLERFRAALERSPVPRRA
jgi:hypothetical protein